MLCEECGNQEASFHYTEIVNGVTTGLHLCEECAKKRGFILSSTFSLADLLGGLLEPEHLPSLKPDLRCKNCGFTYSNFKETGFLGCSQCYSFFHKPLEPLLKKIHGSSKHIGKFPKKKREEKKEKVSDIQLLREKLKEAIAKEEFEEAARLRDKIKETEKD
ncbi:MAG: UvrB/UvrC motif-containing protein [Candidatus Omnitrophica bacterium]|nr:UvrB/UvrC motif-containing protein [Candidatus Omnitrophota bacterium]